MRERIYIAGPYTQGDVAANVHAAIEAANELADLGFAPFVPHLNHFWHLLYQRPYEFWMEMGVRFVPVCDAVLRLPGESDGADFEVRHAKTMTMPVFYDVESLDRHFGQSGKLHQKIQAVMKGV